VLGRFGFITTNSLRQTFNREVIGAALASKNPLTLRFVIPDHPWVDSVDGAAVRIAMTVADRQGGLGRYAEVGSEDAVGGGEIEVALSERGGTIHSDLRIGANVASVGALAANGRIAGMGVALHGSGFIVEPTDAIRLRPGGAAVIKPYLGGRDLLNAPRERYLIDFTGLTQEEALRANAAAFQQLIDYVKPERDHNNRKVLREVWWRFGWERPVLRAALSGLPRYIATTETSKHRVFQFIAGDVLCDHGIVCVASDEAAVLALLSSTAHERWALRAGGRLGVGNDPRYNKSRCFDPYPFPILDDDTRASLATLGDQLDAHRKRQQAAHPGLTLTGMYNVLEKLRSGEPLNPKERVIHEQGMVSVLRQIHDELDAAVLAAYGWADLLPVLRAAHGNDAPAEGQAREDAKRAFDDAVLERLVALNAERAAEEARGLVRWLRPEFQNPSAQTAPAQGYLAVDSDDDSVGEAGDAAASAVAIKPKPWPKDAVDQVRAVAELLSQSRSALSLDDIAARFTARGPWKKRLPQLLDMLAAVGRATPDDSGTRWTA
jgi:hypothetical protein